jgi:hypothetical protein
MDVQEYGVGVDLSGSKLGKEHSGFIKSGEFVD